jgi:molybdate transport system substrate-binding protein
MRRLLTTVLLALLLPGCKPPAPAGPAARLNIAAAADLKFALDDLISGYHRTHPGTEIHVTYGSSGNFFAQIQNTAPFDLFFSADIAYPMKLADAGLALDGKIFHYGNGRLALWVAKASPLDVELSGISALNDPAVKKIAIANPRHAPYGVAAVAAMQTLGVYDQAEPRLVFGENVAQAAQFIQSGAADLGIIALSLAVAPRMSELGSYWEIPAAAYPVIEQGGIILKRTPDPAAARKFRDHVLSAEGRAVLARYGFTLPGS